jgi:hypothetical protein
VELIQNKFAAAVQPKPPPHRIAPKSIASPLLSKSYKDTQESHQHDGLAGYSSHKHEVLQNSVDAQEILDPSHCSPAHV